MSINIDAYHASSESQLSLKITDEQFINMYNRNINSAEHLKSALRIGLMYLDTMKSDTNIERIVKSEMLTMSNAIEEMKMKIDSQNNTVAPFIDRVSLLSESLVNITKTPALKGVLAEHVLKDLIDTYIGHLYPSWEIVNVAKKGHESDIQITTNNGLILVESKNYNSAVSTDQVNKLITDIGNTSADAAIMVSYDSPISKHRDRFSYEIKNIGRKQVLIVYVSDIKQMDSLYGNGNTLILSAILFIDAFLNVIKNGNSTDPDTLVLRTKEMSDQLYTLIDEHCVSLIQYLRDISNIKFNVNNMRSSMNVTIDNLYKDIFDMEIRMNNTLQELKSKVSDLITVHSIDNLDDNSMYEHLTNVQDLFRFLEGQKSSNKHLYYSQLVDWVLELSESERQKESEIQSDPMYILIDKESTELIVTIGSIVIAKTKSTKSRVDITFNISDMQGKDMVIRYGIEKITAGKLVIPVNQNNRELIERRLIEMKN